MAIISGRYGSVDFTNAITYVKSWTIDYDAALFDATNFDESSGGRSWVAGIPGWSGSFESLYTSGNAAVVPGTSGAAVFRTSVAGAHDLYYGGIILMSESINAPVDGLVTQNYTFQGIGTPDQTTV